MTERFIYRNPKDNRGRDENPSHTLEIEVDGHIVGSAEIEYFSKPFPFYQISVLGVEPEYHGQGYGSKIMEFVEKFLKEKGRAGVLVEAIDPDSPAAGMYARRGWQELPKSGGVHAYNLPKGVSIEALRNYQLRQTDLSERPGWREKYEK